METTSEAAAPNWQYLEQGALWAFMEAGLADSEGVVAAARRSVRYARVDESTKQIVLDTRAFALGLMAAGRGDTPSARFGNTATWIAQFVAQRHPGLDTVLARSLTGTDTLIGGAARSYPVLVSTSMANAATRARNFAQDTVERPDADLRHFVAAHLVTIRSAREFLKLVGWDASEYDVRALKQELYSRISMNPERGEDLSNWEAILQIDENLKNGHRATLAPEDEVDRGSSSDAVSPAVEVSGFASDAPDGSVLDDPLNLNADITAFARLICLAEVTPPLSIGLFGGWGSGKSTFMHRLEAKIADLTGQVRIRQVETPEAHTGAAFIKNVVQIRFNAWHFADANLWASLTAEFFDQLRAGGFSRSGKAIHARLVERVNSHVHRLTAEAKSTRDALESSQEAVRLAQIDRDTAAADATLSAGRAVSQTLVDSVVSAYEVHKADLDELGGKSTSKDISAFVELAKSVRSIGGQVEVLSKFVFSRGWRASLALLAVIAIAFATWLVSQSDIWTRESLLGVVALLAGVGAFSRSILPGVRMIASVARSTQGFSEALGGPLETQLKNIAEKEEALRRATTEADALRAAAARASKSLARYVEPGTATANPPRLLRYMLEDDPDTLALEKEIGLISRVRRLFQAVNEIVSEEKGRGSGTSDEEVPDRIVIYIDDLDRCTPAQVYSVLQAIHLLLAFDLFVVVVGVDVAWVQESLARELRPSLRNFYTSPDEAKKADQEARELATNYMEKIFQLPFWLRRLSSDGADGGSYASYVRSMLQRNLSSSVEPDQDASDDPTFVADDDTIRDNVRLTLEASDPSAPPSARGTVAAGLVEALATVKLTNAEVDFLASEDIGKLAGREPRTVKRFVNIYRIIRARLSNSERADFLGTSERPAAYPIVAVLIAVETGQRLDIANELHTLLSTSTGTLHDELVRPILQSAWAAVAKARGGAPITAEECRPWSDVVKRYSFHRYD